MTRGGSVVVFGWGAFNALLAVVLVAYSANNPFPIAVYWIGIALVATFGTIVLLVARRTGHADSATYRTATASASAGFAGIAAALVGVSFIYGNWLALIALYPAALMVLLLRKETRR